LLFTPRCTAVQVLGEKLGQSDLSRNRHAGTDRRGDVAPARAPTRARQAAPILGVRAARLPKSLHAPRPPLKSPQAMWSAHARRSRTTLWTVGPSAVRPIARTPEEPASVHWSQAGARVTYKRAAAPLPRAPSRLQLLCSACAPPSEAVSAKSRARPAA
jgi:hypothetical protein